MSTFRSIREISATPDQVFAAISDPQRLARWWGPAGFTNTFNVCEFVADHVSPPTFRLTITLAPSAGLRERGLREHRRPRE